jgi:hypothetical protein
MTEEQLKARIRTLEAALADAIEYVENESDTVDGPDGPEANEAMNLLISLKMALNGY